jgi:hypothetical protein
MMEESKEFIRFGSGSYYWFLGLLVFARGMDFLSTWIATPNLVLEANPLAKKLGWRWGIVVNLAICAGFALWVLAAVIISTTSVLVAARNFQSAWLMRSLGEEQYRHWVAQRLEATPFSLYLFCLFAQTLLIAGVGAALTCFSVDLVPFGVGIGIITYAMAVTFYALLSVWRVRHSMRPGS